MKNLLLTAFLISLMIIGLELMGADNFCFAQSITTQPPLTTVLPKSAPRAEIETSTPQNSVVGSYYDDFSTDSGLWTYLGTAYRDSANQYLVLTQPIGNQGGVAFFKVPFTGVFSANFSYKVGGGSGGDGFTLFFYKQEYSTVGQGGSLGFSDNSAAVPGYGIEFDGWQNIDGGGASPPSEAADPSGSHIALIKDWYGNHLAYVNDSRVGDDNWHNVSVVVGDSNVGVFVDNQFVLRWDGTLDKTYERLGFSGGTGCATDWHIIGNFSISPLAAELPLAPTSQNAPYRTPNYNPPLPSSFISISSDASSSQIGSTVDINGILSNKNGTSLGADKTVILYYSVGDNESWFPIGSGKTNTAGEYSIQWVPAASGTFALRTEWSGDSEYAPAVNSTTMSFLPYENQKVFSIESNSTVTGLEFSSGNLTLGFVVSGPSGTTGYTKVAIAKSLIYDVSRITTSVDGKTVNFTASSSNENWILAFTYSHSTHQVTINLAKQEKVATSPTTPNIELPLLPVITVAIIAFLVSALAIMLRRRRNP